MEQEKFQEKVLEFIGEIKATLPAHEKRISCIERILIYGTIAGFIGLIIKSAVVMAMGG